KDQNFKDAIEQFKQAQLKRTQEKEETLRALREQKALQEEIGDVIATDELMAQPMSHLPTHSHLIDIETKDLWKKVMATERHAHP
ncbi:hypothetical protein WAJ76_21530, partial [Acinetobacter baumannii]